MNIRQALDRAGALDRLKRVVPFDCLGNGAGQVADLVEGQALFEMLDAGRVVGAFALGVNDYSDGRVVRCGAVAGDAGFDLVGELVDFAESEAKNRIGARLLACETSRPAMVRKLKQRGFRVAGFVMVKDV